MIADFTEMFRPPLNIYSSANEAHENNHINEVQVTKL